MGMQFSIGWLLIFYIVRKSYSIDSLLEQNKKADDIRSKIDNLEQLMKEKFPKNDEDLKYLDINFNENSSNENSSNVKDEIKICPGCEIDGKSNESILQREERFIQVNPAATWTLGFLWNAPVALILPTLTDAGGGLLDHKYDYVDYDEFYNDEEKSENKDSPERSGEAESRSLKNKIKMRRPESLNTDPAYVKQTEKLMTLFGLLKVPYLECQERMVCEMAFDTYTYEPVSKYILRELKLNHGPVSKTEDSLMWRYVSSARKGLVAKNREACSSTCPMPSYKILNMAVLKVWQYLASRLNLNII